MPDKANGLCQTNYRHFRRQYLGIFAWNISNYIFFSVNKIIHIEFRVKMIKSFTKVSSKSYFSNVSISFRLSHIYKFIVFHIHSFETTRENNI